MKTFKLIMNFVTGQANNFVILVELILMSVKVVGIYQTTYLVSLCRAYKLARTHHFRADEAFELGLYSPEISDEELNNYISKRRLSNTQAKINPQNWFWVTESKDVFYKFCMDLGMPIPEAYAFYYRNSSGWTPGNIFPRNAEEWADILKTKLPDTFVIKPARGVYGIGLAIYKRHAEGFIDTDGNQYTPETLLTHMQSDVNYDAFIIQERLMNHTDLDKLCASEYLQTLRINTFIDKKGECRVDYSVLKLITGSSIADNFHGGITGNLVVYVDVQTGILSQPLGPVPDRPGYYLVSDHPKIKTQIDGFQLPLWKETCECVITAAFKFSPIRSIGWDVAITPGGAVIVEANIRWDPMFPNMYAAMGEILRRMKED